MLQMLGRLMWIGVGAVAVKALEAGLKSHYFDTTPTNGSNGNGNRHAASPTPRPRRRRSTAKPAAH
jgi:hypothetical protein